MVTPERRRSRDSGEISHLVGLECGWVSKAAAEDGDEERADAVEGEPGDAELGGELVSPSEEEIGDEGHRGVRVGGEPLDNGLLEFGECIDEGVVSSVADLTEIFCTCRNVWV